MSTVTLFGYPQSTYFRTARMACEEKGVDYDIDNDFAARHPFRKMPAMRHGAVELFETVAICDYIDRTFDGRSLQPKDVARRARMLQWISAIGDYVYRDVVHGEDVERARERLAVLDAALEGTGLLVGKDVSLADLFLAPIVAYASSRDVGGAMFDGFERVAAHQATMQRRDSFTRTAP